MISKINALALFAMGMILGNVLVMTLGHTFLMLVLVILITIVATLKIQDELK